jgi:predicted transcriptional regulator
MGANSKPILSVLVDGEKKERFAELAKVHSRSMNWLLNQAIDKMLEAKTIHIYQDSSATPSEVGELVKNYVDQAVSPIATELIDLSAQVEELRRISKADANILTANSKPSATKANSSNRKKTSPN